MNTRRGLRMAALGAGVLALHLGVLQGVPLPRPASAMPVPLVVRSVAVEAPASEAKMPVERTEPARPAIEKIAKWKPTEAPPAAAPRPAEAAPLPQAEPAALAEPAETHAALMPVAAPASAAPSAPIVLPPPLRLNYEVRAQGKGLTLEGKGQLAFRHDGREYEARWEIQNLLLGTRVQRSNGSIGAEGLVPRRFSDKARHEEATHFERERGKVVFSNNRPEADWAAGMQDRLSVMLQLGALLAGAPARHPPGSSISVPVAGTREAGTWTFQVEALEDLALPGGNVQALRLVRAPRGEYDQRVELWLAPRMDYAPVRLRLTNPNGETVEQRWSSTDRS